MGRRLSCEYGNFSVAVLAQFALAGHLRLWRPTLGQPQTGAFPGSLVVKKGSNARAISQDQVVQDNCKSKGTKFEGLGGQSPRRTKL
jgi:hypothetical protein